MGRRPACPRIPSVTRAINRSAKIIAVTRRLSKATLAMLSNRELPIFTCSKLQSLLGTFEDEAFEEDFVAGELSFVFLSAVLSAALSSLPPSLSLPEAFPDLPA